MPESKKAVGNYGDISNTIIRAITYIYLDDNITFGDIMKRVFNPLRNKKGEALHRSAMEKWYADKQKIANILTKEDALLRAKLKERGVGETA